MKSLKRSQRKRRKRNSLKWRKRRR